MERLTVPGTLDSLTEIRKYVTAAAAAAGLDKKATYRLNLAVDEIATNIIIHGYDEAGREGMIDLWSEIDEKTLTISLEDSGATYNPFQSDVELDLDLPLEQRQIGGLGVYLTIQSVDKFLYEHTSEDRNRHTFVMNRSPASLAQ
ncbi:MAG TPA: ATP-binding protein [Anaerolineae bacterium]|nr:ATP-binding protein [Anaerolineae bacterium]HMR63541.1 ATP-binding protein [Anaerolineae bacterium]